jgi:transposase InsO family protein
LIIKMQAAEAMSLEQIRAFLEASTEVDFKARNKDEIYDWVNQTLQQLHYRKLKRGARGLVRRYLAKMTGLSRAQVTRLLGLYLRGEKVKPKPYRRYRFPRRYTNEDAVLLAAVDEAHDTINGPATQRIMQRAYSDFGDTQYQRLAELSVAQLYRLRKSRAYRQRLTTYQKTRPTKVSIGERRRPQPSGQPGYLRVDTVHQGDLDGVKGVYNITAVDEVTQWQVMGAAQQISEAYLLPVLEGMLAQFPFHIRGFHSDNGSEFINHTVAKLLDKLRIEQTKSRPRHSNDNGLVECKNGAVVRKHMGYTHIAARHAEEMAVFYERYFNPYVNFHRPCGVPEEVSDAKGKVKRVYRRYATPWELLREVPELAKYLKEDVSIEKLEKRAGAQSDTAAAAEMQAAKQKLFDGFQGKKTA